MSYRVKTIDPKGTISRTKTSIPSYQEAQNEAKLFSTELNLSCLVINEQDNAVLCISYVVPGYSTYFVAATSGVIDETTTV